MGLTISFQFFDERAKKVIFLYTPSVNQSTKLKYINNSLHLARKYARIFVRGHYLFREANSFPRAQLEENCELRGTDNVQGQISEYIFAPNGGYCLYYPSNLFRNARNFQNWGIFQLWNIRSRDALRPIARERKYLMAYN